MHTVSIFNQKGGSGKTTLAENLAVIATQAGLKAVILDMDPQATATAWFRRRPEGSAPLVVQVPTASLKRAIEGAQNDGYDLVLIDSPPSVSAATSEIIRSGELVLVPVRPLRADKDALPDSLRLIRATGRPFAFVLSDCPQRAPEIESSRIELQVHGQPILGPLQHWRAIWRAVEEGQAVAEYEPGSAPAQEMQAVYQSLLGLIE